jgi:hypothetical protein
MRSLNTLEALQRASELYAPFRFWRQFFALPEAQIDLNISARTFRPNVDIGRLLDCKLRYQ